MIYFFFLSENLGNTGMMFKFSAYISLLNCIFLPSTEHRYFLFSLSFHFITSLHYAFFLMFLFGEKLCISLKFGRNALVYYDLHHVWLSGVHELICSFY